MDISELVYANKFKYNSMLFKNDTGLLAQDKLGDLQFWGSVYSDELHCSGAGML